MGDGIKSKTLGWTSQNFDANASYDTALRAAMNKWGMTQDEVEKFISKIEWHESKGDHTAKQSGSKEGRGLFQYEMDRKDKQGVTQRQGGSSARRRFGIFMENQGIDVGTIPEDFSKIGPQLQRAIFLADAMAKGGEPKTEGAHNWWLEKHWAGYDDMVAKHGEKKAKEIRFDRSQSFIRDMKDKYDEGY